MAKEDTRSSTPLASAPVTFIDSAFRSRIVVFPDGSHLAVLAGRATVSDPKHIAWLDARPGFKRVGEAN